MDDDHDLRHFDGVCRLFPLPDVVLFPHAVLPLHIFEPRYRRMTEDALASDRLVTMVQWRAPFPTTPGEEPGLEAVGCLGRILSHERLPDGRFNFLLLGCKRVRLGREIPTGRLYRAAEAEILEDQDSAIPQGPRLQEITGLFRALYERHGSLDPALGHFLESKLSLGPLTDLVAHALSLPPPVKQRLLNETRVDRRGEILAELLKEILAQSRARGDGPAAFPPAFSVN